MPKSAPLMLIPPDEDSDASEADPSVADDPRDSRSLALRFRVARAFDPECWGPCASRGSTRAAPVVRPTQTGEGSFPRQPVRRFSRRRAERVASSRVGRAPRARPRRDTLPGWDPCLHEHARDVVFDDGAVDSDVVRHHGQTAATASMRLFGTPRCAMGRRRRRPPRT